jgi:hypothetical protein
VLVPHHPPRTTPLARRRRLYRIIRELALANGFDPAAVTLTERSALHQAATLMLQIEVAQEQLVAGTTIDSDVCIRLSSEARRILTGLRRRAPAPDAAPRRPGPLLTRLAREAAEKEAAS